MLHGAPSIVLDPAAPPAAPAAVKPTASKGASSSKRAKPAAASTPATAKPAAATEPTVPVRVTFLVNLWLNHTPGGAAPLPAAVARKLQPAACRHASLRTPQCTP
eukprot:scaffold110421_cov36-Phaeocystis_antarctica.AAC.2